MNNQTEDKVTELLNAIKLELLDKEVDTSLNILL